MSLTTEIQQFQDEAREGWMPEKQPAPDYGEPWEHTSFRNCIRDRHNVLRQIEDDLRDRSRSCANACAGMADPATEIKQLRRERDEARDRAESKHGLWMAELSRVTELEKQLEAMREAIRVAHRFIRDIVKNHECGDDTDASGEAALAKLQPFIKP